MIVLADYNLNRQAILISGSLVVSGLLELAPVQLRTFEDVGLPAKACRNCDRYSGLYGIRSFVYSIRGFGCIYNWGDRSCIGKIGTIVRYLGIFHRTSQNFAMF